jgi:hypothetical protein
LDEGFSLEPQSPGMSELALVSGEDIGLFVALIDPVGLVVYLDSLTSIEPSPHVVYYYLLSVGQAIDTLVQQLPDLVHPTFYFF